MKALVAAIVVVTVATTFAYGDETMTNNDAARISFSFEDKEIVVALVDNSAARSLVAMLPLTLEFRDYAGSEKISDRRANSTPPTYPKATIPRWAT